MNLRLKNTSFINIFKKENHFELSHIGDFSNFTFTELAQKLPNFKINIDSFQHYFVATFESNHTAIKIKYTSIGQFDSIINESWK
jgi:hypothetical protein